MKFIKKTLKTVFILLLIISCNNDDRNLDFLDSIVAPTNVSATLNVTQDNTGLVTITPNADGANSYEIVFGDNSPNATITVGESVEHTYAEASYEVTIKAFNIKGDATETTIPLIVSFDAPSNIVVTIENDAAITKQVNITVTADDAISYDFYSGESGVTDPVASANIGDAISYVYTNPGIYTIRIVVKGAAIQTTEYTDDFEVTEILQPVTSATAPATRIATDVISIFSDAYTDIAGTDFNPNWGQATAYTLFDLSGDAMLQYSNLNYQGINIGENIDTSAMESLHIDIWTADATSINIFPLPDGVQPADEKFVTKTLTLNQWNSFDILLSDFTNQGLAIDDLKQFKFVGSGTVFIDNLYFFREPTTFQNISDDFEGGGNITSWFGDSCGLDTGFSNPYIDANNPSATVLEYDDTGGQFANIRFDTSPNFNFSSKKTFSMKIYVASADVSGTQPNQVSLKLQDGTASQPWVQQTEVIKPIVLDTWQTVTFDFENDMTSGAANPLDRTDFNRVVIQVNGENNTDTVKAYIDDFQWGNDLFVGPLPNDNFEGGGNITSWFGDSCGLDTNFANPHMDSTNPSATVLEYNDTGGQFANIRFDTSSNFNMEKYTFSLKIYVASSDISGTQPNQISLKLQDGTVSQPWVQQTEIIKPIVLDTWQTVTFNFATDTMAGAANPLDRTDFNRVVLQVNGENNTDSVKAYIDDFTYN